MPRKNGNENEKNGGKCKIRKRGCSSSSSSSLVHNYRLKRALLVEKRRGSNTPMPTWKMSTRLHLMHHNDKASTGTGKQASILSVRKLAATLWEINELPSNDNLYNNLKDRGSRVDLGRGKVSKSSKLGPMALPDLSHGHVLKSMDRQRRRKSVDLRNALANDTNLRVSDSHGNATFEQVEAQPRRQSLGTKSRLKDISQGLNTSKELLKVLVHICELDKQNSTSKSLVTGLKFEIDCAHAMVENLIKEQQCDHKEVDYLLKQFAEERLAMQTKEKERIDVELEVEKKLRKESERLNKKLGQELERTKLSLSKAEKAVGKEKRARERLEQVCDELARGIGEDLAEVEKEREMLQVADDLREARVQMKLSEAKFQFEEKNAAVEKLRTELESSLRPEKGGEIGQENGSYDYDDSPKVMQACQLLEDKERDVAPDHSDVQSIELNVENNGKAYGWSFADGKMESDSITTKGICLERQISDAIEWEFSSKLLEDDAGGLTSKERFVKFTSKVRKEDHEDEIRRYKMIKDLRDHIVYGNSGLTLLQEAA